MTTSRAIVDGIERDGRPVYGVSTGFGALARHLRRAGAAGRAAARADPFARGRHRRADAARGRPGDDAAAGPVARDGPVRRPAARRPGPGRPAQPRRHAVGAASTARSARPATWPRWPTARWCCSGEGWVLGKDGARSPAAEALAAAGLRPIDAGRQGGARADQRHRRHARHAAAGGRTTPRHLFAMADVTAALAIEAMLGSDRPFLRRAARDPAAPGPGRVGREHLPAAAGSAIMDSHRDDLTHAVQDAYSMRCAPQVAGAARDTLDFAPRSPRASSCPLWTTRSCCPTVGCCRPATSTARRSASRPTSWPSRRPRSAPSSERRVDRLLDVTRSRDLPAFLTPDPGVNSGLMIAQYTAAGIVAENRRLASPASVDSVPDLAACRRTTSRWAGPPPASCARCWTT